jgi:hypothetical protein
MKARITALLAIVIVAVVVMFVRRSKVEELATDPTRIVAMPAPVPGVAAPAVSNAPEAIDPSRTTDATPPRPEPEPANAAAQVLDGRAVDERGEPVESFFVEVRQIGSEESSRLGEPTIPPRRIIGKDGVFSAAGLPEGDWGFVARGSHGARSAELIAHVPWDEEPLVLVIVPAINLRGIVLGAGDAPVRSASVYLTYAGEELPTPGTWSDHSKPAATTDANGRFQIERVHPGQATLLATHPEHCDSDYTRVALRPGGAEIVLHLRAGARVVGSIDPSMGALAEREIHLYSFRGSIGWRETKSDELGRFAFEHVIPQDYVIELKTDAPPRRLGGDPADAERDDGAATVANRGVRKRISAQEATTTEVVLGAPARTIVMNGRVACRGEPVSGITVDATPLGGSEDRGEDATSAADGTFRLELQGPGRYWVTARQDRFDYYVEQEVPDVPSLDVEIDLPGGRITGTLVDLEGRRLQKKIRLTVQAEGRATPDDPFFFGNGCQRIVSNEDGTFEFAFLPAGRYTVRAPDGHQFELPPRFEGYGRVLERGIQVGQSAVAGLTLRVPPESRIVGTIRDEFGSAVGGAALYLEDDEGRIASTYWETESDSRGSFEVRHVGPGRWRVVARWSGRRADSPLIDVELGQILKTSIRFR